jgi:hypothetical protein
LISTWSVVPPGVRTSYSEQSREKIVPTASVAFAWERITPIGKAARVMIPTSMPRSSLPSISITVA